MPHRAYRVLVPVLVISLLTLAVLLSLMDSSFHAAQVAGYPGQEDSATATLGPGPGTPGPPLDPSPTPIGGPESGCGQWYENHAWFGNTKDKGFWAIQFYTTKRLLDICLSPNQTGCNAQWLGSWWFYDEDGEPGYAYLGAVFNNDQLLENPNAWHYRDAINCHLSGQSCTPSPTPTPTPTATESSGGVEG